MLQDSNPSCRALAYNWYFDQSNCVPAPTVNNIDPQLQALTPSLSNVLANRILNTARSQPNAAMFIYLANLVGGNGFKNDVWGDMVQYITLMYWKVSRENPNGSPVSITDTAVNRLLVGASAFYAANNQLVTANLSPEDRNAVPGYAQFYQQLTAELRALRQSSMHANSMPVHNPMMVNNPAWSHRHGAAPVSNQAAATMASRPINVATNIPQAQEQNSGYHGHRTFRASEMDKQTKEVRNSSDLASLLGLGDKVPSIKEEPQPTTTFGSKAVVFDKDKVAQVDIGVQGVTQAITKELQDVKWAPTATQLFKPCVNSLLEERVLKLQALGSDSVPYYKTEDLKEEAMNKAEHDLSFSAKLLTPEGLKGIRVAEQMDADLMISADTLDALRQVEPGALTDKLNANGVVRRDADGVFNSLTEAVRDARIWAAQESEPHTTYTVHGEFLRAFVTRKDHENFLTEVGSSKNFAEICEQINKWAGIAKKEQDTDLKQMVVALDRYLAEEINSLLKVRMGLGSIRIQSFAADVQDLPDYMRKKMGEIYANSFKEHAGDFIDAALNTLNQSGVKENSAEEGPALCVVTTIGHTGTVCVTTLTEELFGVKIENNESHEVMATNAPGLHAYIARIVEIAPDALHYYLVTADNTVYELAKSIVGEAYVIAKGPTLV